MWFSYSLADIGNCSELWTLQWLLRVTRWKFYLAKKSIPRVFQNPFLLLVKMEINQGYLLVLLLASLSPSYTSGCPTTELYDECAKLYNILEAALLKNPGNLYQLHDSFFPSSSSEPIYASVTYNFKRGSDGNSSRDCACTSCYSNCWTSSVLLRSVHPDVLTGLQVHLLNVLLETVGASDLTGTYYSYGAHLCLELNVRELNSFDYNIRKAVLLELTPWVSA